MAGDIRRKTAAEQSSLEATRKMRGQLFPHQSPRWSTMRFSRSLPEGIAHRTRLETLNYSSFFRLKEQNNPVVLGVRTN